MGTDAIVDAGGGSSGRPLLHRLWMSAYLGNHLDLSSMWLDVGASGTVWSGGVCGSGVRCVFELACDRRGTFFTPGTKRHVALTAAGRQVATTSSFVPPSVAYVRVRACVRPHHGRWPCAP